MQVQIQMTHQLALDLQHVRPQRPGWTNVFFIGHWMNKCHSNKDCATQPLNQPVQSYIKWYWALLTFPFHSLAANASGVWVRVCNIAALFKVRSLVAVSNLSRADLTQPRSHHSKARTFNSLEIIDEYRSVKLSKLFSEWDSLMILFAHQFQIWRKESYFDSEQMPNWFIKILTTHPKIHSSFQHLHTLCWYQGYLSRYSVVGLN